MATRKKLHIDVKTTGADKAQRGFRGLGQSISKTSTIISTVFASAAAAGAINLAKMAAQARDVRAAFNNLNRPDLLRQMRNATRGTVSDLELMKQSVMAKNFQISLEQLPKYFEFASRRARETGQNVDYLVESIITGIGRKSVLILDNLGISAVRIREEFKKTGDFAAAAGKIIAEEMAKGGATGEYAADAYSQFSAAMENLSIVLGEKLLPVLTPVVKGLTEIANAPQEILYSMLVQAGIMTHSQNIERQVRAMEERAIAQAEAIEKQKQFIAQEQAAAKASVNFGTAIYATAEAMRLAREEGMEDLLEVTAEYSDSLQNSYGPAIVNMANMMAGSLQNAIVNQWESGANALQNFQKVFENLAAQIMARAAIFGLFNLIPGFGAMGAGGFSQFVFGFAQGGRPSPGMPAMVGEHGPEMFVPDRSGTIVPSHKTNNTFNLHFHGPVTNTKFIRDSVLPQIRKSARLGY